MDYCKEAYLLLTDTTIQEWTLMLTALSTILWGVYVVFTIRTFNQIKKQTDIQSRAYLLVIADNISNNENDRISQKAIELHEKFKGILERNIPDAVLQEQFVELILDNRGKSDIKKFEIDFRFILTTGQYLTSTNTTGEEAKWNIKSKSSDIIKQDSIMKINVMKIGYFPKGILYWTIKYEDLREEKYESTNKDDGYEVYNKIAHDYKPTV